MKEIMKKSYKVGKYKVGAPVVSDSYKDRTPKWIKVIGESCLFVGAAIPLLAGTIAFPPWVIVSAPVFGLAGRHIAKMFSE